MVPIQPGDRPKLARRARLQRDRVTGKPVLLYPEGVLVLNPTGFAIVTLCTGQSTLEEIVITLAGQYKTSPAQLRVEVVEYLDRLRSRNLLEVLTTAD
jgi:pyrroloquinoline quinone biosynthesis protein D